MGYIKKKSTKSAMAGGASGTIMLVAAILMRSPSTLKLGVYIACGTLLHVSFSLECQAPIVVHEVPHPILMQGQLWDCLW